MESWGSLLSNIEGDEIEGIFQSVSDHRLNTSPDSTRPSLDTARHDSGVSVDSVKEEDTKPVSHLQELKSLPQVSGSVDAQEQPTKQDFDNALWVTTKLNGITQYRAPRHTTSPTTSLTHTSILHPTIAKESTAIDLSTSISSSFALQCAAAGFSKTLCRDTNPWNIEGLRRSCHKNNWHIQVHDSDDNASKNAKISPKTKVITLIEHQDTALASIEKMQTQLPPIRCVRCQDSSTSSQATAAAALDHKLGGWIYVHAALNTDFITASANQIRCEFEDMIKRLDNQRGYLTDIEGAALRRPRVEYIQRGGLYNLAIVSCVIVIYIPPISRI